MKSEDVTAIATSIIAIGIVIGGVILFQNQNEKAKEEQIRLEEIAEKKAKTDKYNEYVRKSNAETQCNWSANKPKKDKNYMPYEDCMARYGY